MYLDRRCYPNRLSEPSICAIADTDDVCSAKEMYKLRPVHMLKRELIDKFRWPLSKSLNVRPDNETATPTTWRAICYQESIAYERVH